ncbi:porin family protein [Vibrio gigantis]|uniref:porin family protein n=1 Tax=Vibrio gigantis TaxID=296199 RepID=UPI0035A5F3A3
MKKTLSIATLIAATLLPNLANADINVQPFFGMGSGVNIDSMDHSDSDNEFSGALQVRTGVILEDTHRLMLSYQYSGELEQSNYLSSYDYMYSVAPKVKVFAGTTAGMSDSDLGYGHESEFVWGGQVGAVYQFDNITSLELMYRYLDQDNEVNGEVLDSTQEISASIDFRF